MLYEEDSEISVEMQTSFSSEKASNRISNSTTDSHLCQRQEQIKRENMSTILTVMICSTMWSLVTTVVPVFVHTIGSNNLHPEYDGWYRGSDIVRFVEPVGGLFFSFWMYHSSGILNYDSRSYSFNHMITGIFVFGVSLYLQGGAFHSASNMFQHGVRIFLDDYLPIDSLDTPEEEAQREYMEDFYYWMRTVWQHIVSHYIYAVGAVIVDVCIMVAYRNHTLKFRDISNTQLSIISGDSTTSPLRGINLTSGKKPSPARSSKTSDVTLDAKSVSLISRLVIVNGVLYAALLSGVAINFPSGVIVAFIYFPLFLICLLRYLYVIGDWELRKKENWRLMLATRPVLNLNLLAYTLAMVCVVVWVASVGGFKKRSNAT